MERAHFSDHVTLRSGRMGTKAECHGEDNDPRQHKAEPLIAE
jgi:hypothetical protein